MYISFYTIVRWHCFPTINDLSLIIRCCIRQIIVFVFFFFLFLRRFYSNIQLMDTHLLTNMNWKKEIFVTQIDHLKWYTRSSFSYSVIIILAIQALLCVTKKKRRKTKKSLISENILDLGDLDFLFNWNAKQIIFNWCLLCNKGIITFFGAWIIWYNVSKQCIQFYQWVRKQRAWIVNTEHKTWIKMHCAARYYVCIFDW